MVKDYVEEQREKRKKNILEHKCYECGKKLPKNYVLITCQRCLIKRRERNNKRYKTKVVDKTKMEEKESYSKWTKREIRFLKKNRNKYTIRELGNELGGNFYSVGNQLRKIGLTKGSVKKAKVCCPRKYKKRVVKCETITINVPLVIKKVKDELFIRRPETLVRVIGTTDVMDNLGYYGVRIEGNRFVVSIENVKRAVKLLESRKKSIERRLDVMRQIV